MEEIKMENNQLLRIEDLVNNPTPRVPVCLCLDVSGSMDGAPIDELNRGVREFYESIKADETAYYATEIAIVTFGGTGPCCVCDFASMELQPNPPVLTASGLTPMAEAVDMALNLLENRKSEYSERGVDYYQPWLVLMTDGKPTSDKYAMECTIERAANLINQRKLTIFPIGIGASADMKVLAAMSPKRRPLSLNGLKFAEFFEWLSKSVSKTSQSTPGEKVYLDMAGISDWATL